MMADTSAMVNSDCAVGDISLLQQETARVMGRDDKEAGVSEPVVLRWGICGWIRGWSETLQALGLESSTY